MSWFQSKFSPTLETRHCCRSAPSGTWPSKPPKSWAFQPQAPKIMHWMSTGQMLFKLNCTLKKGCKATLRSLQPAVHPSFHWTLRASVKHAEVQTIYGMRLQNPQERQVSYTPYPRQLGERERGEREKGPGWPEPDFGALFSQGMCLAAWRCGLRIASRYTHAQIFALTACPSPHLRCCFSCPTHQ